MFAGHCSSHCALRPLLDEPRASSIILIFSTLFYCYIFSLGGSSWSLELESRAGVLELKSLYFLSSVLSLFNSNFHHNRPGTSRTVRMRSAWPDFRSVSFESAKFHLAGRPRPVRMVENIHYTTANARTFSNLLQATFCQQAVT